MIRRGAFVSFAIVSMTMAAQAQIQFAPAVEYNLNAPDASSGYPNSPTLAIADFNKDGRPDVATNFNASVVVVLNHGDGTFNAPVAYSVPGTGTAGVVTGDFNRDGYPDLAVLSISPGVLRVRFNGKDGTFGNFTDYPLKGASPSGVLGESIAVGDFDGDGYPDIAVQYFDYNGDGGWYVQIFHSDADGSLTPGTPLAAPTAYGYWMYSADLNVDGLADLYFPYGQSGNSFSVYLNQGNGKFTNQTYPVGGWTQWIPVDLKGKGKPDLFGSSSDSYAPLSFLQLPNRGDGTFGSVNSVDPGLPFFPIPLAAGDMNGDGSIDLVAMGDSSAAQNLVVVPNTGGTLGTAQLFVSGTEQLAAGIIGLADFDGDGRLDIVLVNAHQNPNGAEMYVIRNTTPGSGPPPSIIGIFPPQRGNAATGTLSSIQITGNGFPQDVIVKLVGPGGLDITATNVIVAAAGNLITASFNLVGVPAGSYTLVLTKPDGTVLLSDPAAFTVVQGGAPNIWVDFVGRSVIRGGQQQEYYILVGNSGNIDATQAAVWVQLPSAFSYSLGQNQTPTSAIQIGADKFLYFELANILPASTTLTFPISLAVPDIPQYGHYNFQIQAWGNSQ